MSSRPGGRGDAGFTLVEVVVAMMILAIGTLAVLGVVNAASRNNYRAQQSQVVNDLLQQEMEKIKQLPYAQAALTDLPPHSSDPSSPNLRVSGAQFNVNARGAAPGSYFGMVYDGGHSNENGGTVACRNPDGSITSCGIDPGPTPFQTGNISGNIYRYVVWQPAVPPFASCGNCAHNPNSDAYNGQRVTWFKHVIIALTLNNSGTTGVRPYQEIQGDLQDPNEGQGSCATGDPNCSPSQNTATPWTFWLTDTPCISQTRQPIIGNHKTHNTRGLCGDGMKTSDNSNCGVVSNLPCPGAPDLMFTQPAPCVGDPPDCSSDQTLYNYSNDITLQPPPTPPPPAGPGLTPRHSPSNGPPAGTGCRQAAPPPVGAGPLSGTFGPVPGTPDTDSIPSQTFHKWVSPPIPSGY